jgi:hypothetical protein
VFEGAEEDFDGSEDELLNQDMGGKDEDEDEALGQ